MYQSPTNTNTKNNIPDFCAREFHLNIPKPSLDTKNHSTSQSDSDNDYYCVSNNADNNNNDNNNNQDTTITTSSRLNNNTSTQQQQHNYEQSISNVSSFLYNSATSESAEQHQQHVLLAGNTVFLAQKGLRNNNNSSQQQQQQQQRGSVIRSCSLTSFFTTVTSSTSTSISTSIISTSQLQQQQQDISTSSETSESLSSNKNKNNNNSIYLWETQLPQTPLQNIIGLTLVEFVDAGPILVVCLKKEGFILIQTVKGKLIRHKFSATNLFTNSGIPLHNAAKTPSPNSTALNAGDNNNNNNNINNTNPSGRSAIFPCIFPPSSSSQNQNNFQIIHVQPSSGGLFLAGERNSITGYTTNLHLGFISQSISLSSLLMSSSSAEAHHHFSNFSSTNSSLVSSSSHHHHHQNHHHHNQMVPVLAKWIKLPTDSLLGAKPKAMCRNLDSGFAVSFDGAPHVYFWIDHQSDTSSQNNNKNKNSTTASSLFFLNSNHSNNNTGRYQSPVAGVGSSSNPSSSQLQLSSAFLASNMNTPSSARHHNNCHQSTMPTTQQQLFAFEKNSEIKVENSFMSITSLIWVTDSLVACGTSCGHVGFVDFQSGTRRTSFDPVSSIRLPVRSAVAATVEFLLVLPPSTTNSENNFSTTMTTTKKNSLVLCVTSRADMFIVSPHSCCVTHTLFSDSPLLRQPVFFESLQIFTATPNFYSGSGGSGNSPSFICQETSIDHPEQATFVKISFYTFEAEKLTLAEEERATAATANNKKREQKEKSTLHQQKNQQNKLPPRQEFSCFGISNNNNKFLLNNNNNNSIYNNFWERNNNSGGSFGLDSSISSNELILNWLRENIQFSQQQQQQQQNNSQNNNNNNFFITSGDYQLRKVVGHGNFGEVWLASNIKTKKLFAVKRLIGFDSLSSSSCSGNDQNYNSYANNNNNNNSSSSSAAASAATHALHNEEFILNIPSHPNLIQGFGGISSSSSSQKNQQQQNEKGLALSFAFGGSLESCLEQHCYGSSSSHSQKMSMSGGISSLELISWLNQLLSGLAHLHSFGILHRDIKPANVLDRGSFSGARRFCWSDFGVSRLLSTNNNDNNQNSNNNNNEGKRSPSPKSSLAAATKAGTIVGTPAYNSPEMLAAWLLGSGSAPASAASDVWSLAAIFYCFLMKRIKGTAEGMHDVRIVTDGNLPTLEQTSSQQPKQIMMISPPDFPLRYLKLLDAMMRLDRKDRPTAQQCLIAMRIQNDENDVDFSSSSLSSIYNLGKNSILRDSTTRSADYLLTSYHSNCDFFVPNPEYDGDDNDNNNNANSMSFLTKGKRETLEFWSLNALLPSSTNSSSSSCLKTTPKIFCSKLTIFCPNRSIAQGIRIGIISACLAPKTFLDFFAGGSSDDNSNSKMPFASYQEQEETKNNNSTNNNNNQQHLCPRYISDFVSLAPLLSVSENLETVHHHHQHPSSSSSQNQNQNNNTFHANTTATQQEKLTFDIEYMIDFSPSIVSIAQWIDASSTYREAIRRLNKSFKSLLKFLAFCSTEPELHLPIASFNIEDLFVDVDNEKLIIGRSPNLLTVALIVDAVDKTEHCSSSLLQQLLLQDAELKKYAELMSRSTLDSVLIVVDEFFRFFERLKEFQETLIPTNNNDNNATDASSKEHNDEDNSNDDQQEEEEKENESQQHQQQETSSAKSNENNNNNRNNNNDNNIIQLLCRATEFVGLHVKALQIRKKKRTLNQNSKAKQPSSSSSHQQQNNNKNIYYDPRLDAADPDETMFINFF